MKKPVAVTLTIPEPCNEDWEQMKPSGCGRFCSRCEKTVIDFTLLSDEQIARLLLSNKDKQLCGHVYHHQLNRPIQVPLEKKERPILRKMATAAALLAPYLSTLPARAQNHKPLTTAPAKADTLKRIYIKGSIKDVVTGKPLIGMEIRLDSSDIKYSDAKGNFTFVLPDSFIGKTIKVSAAYQPGASPELPNSVILDEMIQVNNQDTYTLQLFRYPVVQPESDVIVETRIYPQVHEFRGGGAIAIVTETHKTSIWQRIGNIFRKKHY